MHNDLSHLPTDMQVFFTYTAIVFWDALVISGLLPFSYT